MVGVVGEDADGPALDAAQGGDHAEPEAAAQLKRRAVLVLGGTLALLAALAGAIATGALPVTPEQISNAYSYILLAVTVVFFGWLFTSGNWTPDERKRLYLIGVFFLAAALFFWAPSAARAATVPASPVPYATAASRTAET